MKKTINFNFFIRRFIKQLTVLDYGLFLVVITGMIFFLFFLKRENIFIDVKFKITDPDVLYMNTRTLDEYAVSFVIGDKELNELGQTIAEIIKVDTYRTNTDRQVVYLTMRIKANYSPRKKLYSIKGRPVVVGQSFTYTLTKVKFEGIVVDFPGFTAANKTFDKKTVKTQIRDSSREYSDTYGVPSYIAYAVKAGDQVKDSQGNVLAKVLQVDVLPAKRTVLSADNRTLVVNDPELKDVFYTLELSVYKDKDRLFMFDYLPVYIGQVLPLNFPSISIWPTIIEIE